MKILPNTKSENLFFFDTEFYENGETITPISFGFVKEGNPLTPLYLVNADFDRNWMEKDAVERGSEETIEFLNNNVFNNLNSNKSNTLQMKSIKRILVEYLGEAPILWTSTGCYDWVLFCQLFGRMLDLPEGYPFSCKDTAFLKSMFPDVQVDKSKMKKYTEAGEEHNALYDAYEVRLKYWAYKNHIDKNKIPIKI